MSINEHFNEFIDYLSSEKNISKYTKENYSSDFKIFLNFLSSNSLKSELEAITTPILRKYFSYLKNEKQYQNQTMRRKIHSLSSFFKFLLEQEYIEKNPMLPIHAPKLECKVPIYLKENDIKTLIKATMQFGGEYALRDKCIIETFLLTGMRRQELLALNWVDIDFKQNTIVILKGKGKKQRIVPMTEPLISDLWAYLQTRLPLENQAVFISATTNRMSRTSVEILFRKYLKKTGLTDKGYTIHKLRHTFASMLIKKNANLLTVQKLLGHSDLNSTKIYTHIDTEYLRKEVEKLPSLLD